ncbi:hypothetical protein Z517_09278 [Fonsecaea pedrosoi CBS 271.37]|uniref:Uncharacterized protein n=1 Tax=Fonsecaea pedrosoi CBS 271.37 TaxID=1442368 RepID=A0A0D2GWU4_9EURO|nr:uncharacterized protein Z517_09278 [Fonsecaea pedrosoi CBS 271.37]KIW76834.1 hypothetical protein Z517_09278 [Fonsecaea pedrosoi CBS 271.37]
MSKVLEQSQDEPPTIPTPFIDGSLIPLEWPFQLAGTAGLSIPVIDVLRFQPFFDGERAIPFVWNRTSHYSYSALLLSSWSDHGGLTLSGFTSKAGVWQQDGTCTVELIKVEPKSKLGSLITFKN